MIFDDLLILYDLLIYLEIMKFSDFTLWLWLT